MALGVSLAQNGSPPGPEPFPLASPRRRTPGRRHEPPHRHHESRRETVALLRVRQPVRIETPPGVAPFGRPWTNLPAVVREGSPVWRPRSAKRGQPAVTPPPSPGPAVSSGAAGVSVSSGATSSAGASSTSSTGASVSPCAPPRRPPSTSSSGTNSSSASKVSSSGTNSGSSNSPASISSSASEPDLPSFFLRLLRFFLGFLFGQVLFLDFFPGGDHAVPDQRRVGAAHHRTAVIKFEHRRRRVGVADPDAGGHFGGDPAAEPGVALFLGRAGLAPLFRPAGIRRGPGALGDDRFHDRLLLARPFLR